MMKYSILLRLIHWLMALRNCRWLVYDGLDTQEGRGALYGWHKSFGMLTIILLVLRLLLRQLNAVPNLPEGIKPAEKRLSN